MVSPTCFGITLPSSASVPGAFWEMLSWGAVDRILWMGVLCLVTWCVAIWDLHEPRYSFVYHQGQIILIVEIIKWNLKFCKHWRFLLLIVWLTSQQRTVITGRCRLHTHSADLSRTTWNYRCPLMHAQANGRTRNGWCHNTACSDDTDPSPDSVTGLHTANTATPCRSIQRN
jgi:hypothetical protein